MLLEHPPENPHSAQRELAKQVDFSFSKLNSCQESLMTKDWLKVLIDSNAVSS